MGVKIFRSDNCNRIKNGNILRRDIMGLHPNRDKELIRYLIAHAPEASRSSMMKYAAEKYGLDEMPEPLENIDDPNDARYEDYVVLREQVVREEDADVLKDAALYNSDYDMAAFAFCRLTGYRFPSSECDAYSYRTFSCNTLPEMTEESIREFCLEVIEKGGRFKEAATKYLCVLCDADR